MPPSARQRSLTSLIQDVGRAYLRRLLPPAWLALAILAAACAWMALSAHDLIALSALAIALGGLLVNWPRRAQRAWPLWRTLALALAASLEAVPGWAHHELLRGSLFAIATASTLHALVHLAGSVRLSLRLQRSARSLDEASLLAALPADAREDARRWCAGDDSKSKELSLVVNLAALWAALSAVGGTEGTQRRSARL